MVDSNNRHLMQPSSYKNPGNTLLIRYLIMDANNLSIIIPVLNDAPVLRQLLEQLARQEGINYELLVADGGSTDASVTVARSHGALLVTTPPGRGRQMNAAAALATGEHLLFVHADSRLPHPLFLAEAMDFMCQTLRTEPCSAGHFSLHFFDSSANGKNWWSFWETKSRLNRPECIHGDQGLWITRPLFDVIGGFDATYPFLEERLLTQKISHLGQWVLLPGRLETSSRRFIQEGLVQRTLLNALMMICHEIELHDFLQRAPALYREHGKTRHPLTMLPFFRLITDLQRAMSPKQRGCHWHAIGRSLRRSLWQIFLFFDVLSHNNTVPNPLLFLHFFNRHLEPLLPRLLPDPVAAVGSRLLFHSLRLYFQWSEH
ncbi:MAG: TIGR04283 family arsenosugar biosynthesis glycosyltransferase [Magnetococcales bacterium]|nr:TIGR04283 family arsenosugar biosynthesis glycosyltransferase [Magnetococcales bacterium]